MTDTVLLNQTELKPYSFKKETDDNGAVKITMDFKVHSSNYHAITTLLYNQTFEVYVPRENLSFKGTIINYTASLTNLYEKGAVGDFHLELLEIQ
ncbi:YkvR family protein [Metabacillus idriensis]|uniref:DUF3219 family protein n=1 Tax=Metabacillus idriensis TaxID=324768 RepID=UPI00174AEA80|nr:DUF3219 family protein [Metabacillus idriensis]MCM3596882.1 YkvR family protein [Metabacillus idriensis]